MPLNEAEILRRRLHSQRLAGAKFAAPEDAVRCLLAVQSQDFAGAKWALGQRTRRATNISIERAYNEGRILRTHVMRPTWHFVLPDDISWLLALTAPRVRALMTHYDRSLDIDAQLRKKCARLLQGALSGRRHLTRTEIARLLAKRGIEAAGQRLAHIVMHAELDGIICSGPMRAKQFTYALLEERAPSARRLHRDEALAELVVRYFRSHGPATVKDCAWWSGLTQADIKAGIKAAGRSALLSEDIADMTYYYTSRAAPPVPEPHVRLLPNYDEYVVGYRGQELFLDRARSPRIRNDALSAHFIVIDGRIAGGWRRTADANRLLATAWLFTKLNTQAKRAVTAEFTKYGDFTGGRATVEWRDPP